jgi:hypothetical protein
MPASVEELCVYDVKDELSTALGQPETIPKQQKALPLKIRWRNVVLFAALHVAAIYGLLILPFAHPFTWMFSMYTKFMHNFSSV